MRPHLQSAVSGEPEIPFVDPEEARTGLLLFAPADTGPTFPDELAAVLATGAVAALVLADASPFSRGARERCRAAGVACLALDDPELARMLRADGVHLGNPTAVPEVRRRLGTSALIGADCGRSRHAAMVAGEEGADYVMFGVEPGRHDAVPLLAELCGWWTGLFVLPCAVDLRGLDADPAALAGAGADFVAVREAVWQHPAGAARGALDLRRRLDEGLGQRQGSP
jgi:thiamine-phosphate pyrophosphorylase